MKTLRLNAGTLRAAAGTPRKLFILGYGGGVMSVSGFGRLVLDLAGMELPATLPILRDHDATVAGIVGAGVPTVAGGSLTIAATVADSEAGSAVLRLLESGAVLQASIGADALERRDIRAGEAVTVNGRSFNEEQPFTLVTRSKLCECSVLPLGADGSTSVSIAARAAKGAAKMTKTLTFEDWVASLGFDVKTLTDEQKAKLTEAYEKLADVDDDDDTDTDPPASAAALVGILANAPQSVRVKAATEGWSASRCKAAALQHVRASRPGAGVGSGQATGRVSAHGNDLAQCAILMRAGGEAAAVKAFGANTAQAARAAGLHRASFTEIFAAHLRESGVDPGTRRDIDGMILASGPSTAALSELLSNTLNKVLEQQWLQAPATWRTWAAVRSAKDFKPAKSLRPVFNSDLEALGNGGEIKHGSLADDSIPWAVSTFAKILTISRTTLINDDLSGLSELPMGMALGADRTLSDLVYSTVLANPNGAFSAAHGNDQTGPGSALSSTSLTKAIAQMRLQRGPNGAALGIAPATLVVAPELEQTGKEILNGSFQFRDQSTDRQSAGNPLVNAVDLVVEPRLSLGATNPTTRTKVAGAANQWFVFASPAFLPGIVGFLNGQDAPTVQPSDPMGFNFDNPGQSWRCLMDFGFSLGDFRAAQRAVGS